MSRIDEALRRAAEGPVHDRPQRPIVSHGPENAAVSLEDYPAEARARIGPSARSAPRAAGAAVPRDEHLPAVPRSLPSHVIGGLDITPTAVEQYRRLAAVLHEAQVQRGMKTALVSSALPREGKTLTVTNLALTLSESYHRRVLLIDADQRRPAVHELLKIPNTGGLTAALLSDAPNVRMIDVSKYLSVLPAGRPNDNPVAGLSSDRMEAFLKDAAARFDWVLLDTPPVGLLPDVHHLTRIVDGVLLVIAAGVTPYHLVQRAVAEIGPRLFGIVLNRVTEQAIPLPRYYDHYYAAAQPGSDG